MASQQNESFTSAENEKKTDAATEWFHNNIDSFLQCKQLEFCAVDSAKSPSKNKSPRQIPNTVFTKVDPTPIPSPQLIAYSDQCLRDCLHLHIDDDSNRDEIMDVLTKLTSGNMDVIRQYLPQCTPWVHRYCGYQFGYFAGQLGDGRAISLGTLHGMELQLKGSGITPFSRFGDGRAVLFSSIREFLASEAMYHLGISTTRGAVLVGSHEFEVIREQKAEPTAILLRVSRGFLRFGSFETCLIDDEVDHLKELMDFVIATHYRHIDKDDENKYELFWSELVDATVRLAVQWKSVGFVHGVLNTDNCSILGETIDYGPYGFIEYFDENFIPNHSDQRGRYSWLEQQYKMKWNLEKLADALDQIGILSIDQSMKYLKVIRTENNQEKESVNVDAMNQKKTEEFPFSATSDMEHFESFLAENALKIKEDPDFVRNLKDQRGLNFLHCAVINGSPQIIDVLITKHGLDVNSVDIDNYSPLFYALNHDTSDCVERLLAYKPRMDTSSREQCQKVTGFPIYICGGRSVLHQAAESNAIHSCELILEYLKKENLVDIVLLKDFNGFFAHSVASMERKPAIYKLLIDFIRENLDNEMGLDLVLSDDIADKEEAMKMKIAYRSAVQNRINSHKMAVRTEQEMARLKVEFSENPSIDGKENENENENEDETVNKKESEVVEVFDVKFERYWMETLRLKFGFLSSLKMDKVQSIGDLLFDTLQRTACDYTNAMRNLNKLSIFGVAKYENMDDGGQSVAECMKMEDDDYLSTIMTHCASIEIYTKMGYEARTQNTIKRIQWFIDNEMEIDKVSIEEMKELMESLKKRSVMIYDDVKEDEEEFMRLEINEMESEQQKERRDRILWTRFISKYREAVNAEYEGDIAVNECLSKEAVETLKALNDERIKTMNAANPKYVLRNYVMQQSVGLPKKRDYSMVRKLLKMVENPFVDQQECDHNDWTCPVPLEACGFCISCAS